MSTIAAVLPVESVRTLDLAGLRTLTYEQLDVLYRSGRRPQAISSLNGDAVGAMLAWRVPGRGPIAWLLRAWSGSSIFPWEGKSFSGNSDAGTGINRVNLFKRMRWYPFTTRFETSYLDGQPSFILDYSSRVNPWFIRCISDEVREVAPGLFLGPAAIMRKGKAHPILFFALSLQS